MTILKTYEIPIHRKLAETAIKISKPSSSTFYLESKEQLDVTVNPYFETKIYNIKTVKNDIVITTNTLNLFVTHVFLDSEPLYYYNVYTAEAEAAQAVLDLGGYFKEEGSYYYHYHNNSEFGLLLYAINNPLKRSSNIRVRKYKDLLKVTLIGAAKYTLDVKLGSHLLFEPITYKNYLEFYECIFKFEGKVYHIAPTTYEVIEKNEVSKYGEYKDPILEKISAELFYRDYINMKYKTWRSNLLYPQKMNTDYYYTVMNQNPAYKVLTITQSLYPFEGLQICSTNKRTVVEQFTENPYDTTYKTTPLGENFYITFTEHSDNKYNSTNNVPLGKEKLDISMEDLYRYAEYYDSEDDKTISDLPYYLQNNFNRFLG